MTGGERGIGFGIAKHLAKLNYDIAFSYYEGEHSAEDYVKKTKDELNRISAEVYAFSADYTKKDDAKRVFEEVIKDLKGLDLLINIAGINKPKAIQDLTEDNMDYLLNLDFRTYIMMMHYATRFMIDNNIKGNIINITSSRGERVYPNCGLYCGIKAGINRATEAFALDVANAVEFLLSDKAFYITGFTIRVDGGLILPGMPEGSDMDKDGWS